VGTIRVLQVPSSNGWDELGFDILEGDTNDRDSAVFRFAFEMELPERIRVTGVRLSEKLT
jgi:hypothetical protein